MCVVLLVTAACAPAPPRGQATPDIAQQTGRIAIPSAAPQEATGSQSAAIRFDDEQVTVEMGDHFYAPAAIIIKKGTTVTWKMVGQQEHDVIAYDGSFRSLTLGPGGHFSHTFSTPGRYPYFCAPHYGDGMSGEVTVE